MWHTMHCVYKCIFFSSKLVRALFVALQTFQWNDSTKANGCHTTVNRYHHLLFIYFFCFARIVVFFKEGSCKRLGQMIGSETKQDKSLYRTKTKQISRPNCQRHLISPNCQWQKFAFYWQKNWRLAKCRWRLGPEICSVCGTSHRVSSAS